MTNKSYTFKCQWLSDHEPCRGEHKLVLDDNLYWQLMFYIFHHHKQNITQKSYTKIVKEFNDVIEAYYRAHLRNEVDLNHFTTMDLEAEMIFMFCEGKYN